jgi:1-deoxy-D-xylulose-5-phosphate synthase
MAPRNEEEMQPMLEHAIAIGSPVAIRYPRGSTNGRHRDPVAPIVQGKAEVLRRGRGIAILGYGNTVDFALDAYDTLATPEAKASGDLPTVVNARFAKPLDEALLLELANDHTHVITLEEHALPGGFGSAVAEFVSDRALGLHVERIGVPNVLVQHDSQDKQRSLFGLSADAIAARVASYFAKDAQAAVRRQS